MDRENEHRCTSKNFGISKSTLGTSAGPEACFNRPQASHLSGKSGRGLERQRGHVGLEPEQSREIMLCCLLLYLALVFCHGALRLASRAALRLRTVPAPVLRDARVIDLRES